MIQIDTDNITSNKKNYFSSELPSVTCTDIHHIENDNIDWDLVSKQLETVRLELNDKYKNIFILFFFQ